MRLIDADALKAELEEIQPFNWTDSEAEAQEYSDFELFESLINSAPTVDAERHGKWIPHPTEREWDVCTNCGMGCKRREYEDNGYGIEVTEFNYPYCPNCGTRTDKE